VRHNVDARIATFMPLKQDFIHRGPILPPKQSLDMRAVGMALFAHALLILALVLNLDWKTENQGPMQIELWADGTTPTAAPAQSTKPEAKPEPTPTKPEPTPAKPEPEPEPVKPPPPPAPPPEPPPPPPPPPPPAPPAVVETPKNEIDPEIALENERKKKAEQERIEQELAEKKAKEDERREKDRIKREKDAAEKKERERLEQIERLEKEKKERERVEQAERLEKEKKEKEEKEKKALAEKEEKEKKAVAEKKEKEKKEKEEKEKKLAEEKKASEAKAAAAKKAAAEQAFKDAMRGDVMGAAGMPGGSADRNQAGGGNYSGYGAKVRACIQPGVSFPTPPQSGSNPTAQYRVQLKSDGTVSGVKLLKTSGNSNFDQAVERGINRCTPFPKPDSGSYPSYIDVDYRMY
jgi:colicin import membrane protein